MIDHCYLVLATQQSINRGRNNKVQRVDSLDGITWPDKNFALITLQDQWGKQPGNPGARGKMAIKSVCVHD